VRPAGEQFRSPGTTGDPQQISAGPALRQPAVAFADRSFGSQADCCVYGLGKMVDLFGGDHEDRFAAGTSDSRHRVSDL
jgi:hypothetical protein